MSEADMACLYGMSRNHKPSVIRNRASPRPRRQSAAVLLADENLRTQSRKYQIYLENKGDSDDGRTYKGQISWRRDLNNVVSSGSSLGA
ncbi:hypothetical protein V6N13_048904 [Hibiscus sabdariffa]